MSAPGWCSPGFLLEDRNARAIAEVCRQLDGIPLAIELAAARINVLSAEQIANRLQDRFRLLVGAHRTGSARQRTLRAALDWSYGLLSSTEQRLFNRLSVFAGGWTLEAAEAICAGDGIAGDDVLELTARLVEHSLVLADDEFSGERRYRMLETLRQYARQNLDAAGEAGAVCERHCDWYVGFGKRAESELSGPRQADWFERLAVEHDNLRAALAHALATNPEAGLELGTSLTWFWLLRGHVPEGRGWLEALLERSGTSPKSPAAAQRGQQPSMRPATLQYGSTITTRPAAIWRMAWRCGARLVSARVRSRRSAVWLSPLTVAVRIRAICCRSASRAGAWAAPSRFLATSPCPIWPRWCAAAATTRAPSH